MVIAHKRRNAAGLGTNKISPGNRMTPAIGDQSLISHLETIENIHAICILYRMKGNLPPETVDAAIETAVAILGGKWKLIILGHLSEGTRRFNEMRRLMPRITQRMLTLQLRELEADGLLTRKVYPQVPPKVEYSLTEQGKTLSPVLAALREWGAAHASTDTAAVQSAESAAITAETKEQAPTTVKTDIQKDQHRPNSASTEAKPDAAQAKPPSRVGRPWGATGSADVT